VLGSVVVIMIGSPCVFAAVRRDLLSSRNRLVLDCLSLFALRPNRAQIPPFPNPPDGSRGIVKVQPTQTTSSFRLPAACDRARRLVQSLRPPVPQSETGLCRRPSHPPLPRANGPSRRRAPQLLSPLFR